VDWVKNTRASREVILSRGSDHEKLAVRELPIKEAAPVLKDYLERYPITRSYFDATVDSPDYEFVKDAGTRPVFKLIPPANI
jgi:hypothetical protein